jgi:prepilin-type processing-associated H-X9-DG protein
MAMHPISASSASKDHNSRLAGFQFPDPDDAWINLPVDWHNGGINHAFTDGHVGYWKWCHAKRGRKDHMTNWSAGAPLPVADDCDLRDLRWMQRGLIPN